MKVRVKSVQDNFGKLYPSDVMEVIRLKGEMALIETSSGARHWVGSDFLTDLDGIDVDPAAAPQAAIEPELAGLAERIRVVLEEDAPNKWVWKTHMSQDEWIRGALLPIIREAASVLRLPAQFLEMTPRPEAELEGLPADPMASASISAAPPASPATTGADVVGQVEKLEAACNQARLALAGMVSVQSAIDLLDCRPLGVSATLRQPVQADEALVERVFNAAWNCPHSIEHSAITLRVDSRKPGGALQQLHQRLTAALNAAEQNESELTGDFPARIWVGDFNTSGCGKAVIGMQGGPYQEYVLASSLTYSSTQASKCRCGEVKHTPLRRDDMGGYVCLTCIDAELTARTPTDLSGDGRVVGYITRFGGFLTPSEVSDAYTSKYQPNALVPLSSLEAVERENERLKDERQTMADFVRPRIPADQSQDQAEVVFAWIGMILRLEERGDRAIARAETAEVSLAAMTAEQDAAREVLKPFAVLYTESMRDFPDGSAEDVRPDDKKAWGFNKASLTWGDFRRAALAVSKVEMSDFVENDTGAPSAPSVRDGIQVDEAMVERFDAQFYGRHERGFIMRPLISDGNGRLDTRLALQAALSVGG